MRFPWDSSILKSQLSQPPHRRGAPVTWSSWWASVGLFPACSCLSFTGCPELNSALQLWSHQCWVEGEDHFSWPSCPAGNASSNAAKNTLSFRSKGILLIHVQSGVSQDSKVLFCRAASQLDGPWHVLVPWVFSHQVQLFALLCADLHEISVSSPLQPDKYTLDGFTALLCVTHTPWV